jgi:hypothetical protein
LRNAAALRGSRSASALPLARSIAFRVEVVSYPGPDPSTRREQLAGERIIARRYPNRRIGDFLKELEVTEGRSTGIPKSARRCSRTARRCPLGEQVVQRLTKPTSR